MPPKKSKKKDTKGKAPDADAAIKDELWNKMIALREELEQIRKEKNYFQHERDNCMFSWDNAKRRLEQQQDQRRKSLGLKEERDKILQDKINHVHELLQHVQLEHDNAIAELKIEAAACQGRRMKEFTERELTLHKKRVAQQAALLEKKTNLDKYLRALMLKQQEEIIKMKYEYNDFLTIRYKCSVERLQETIREHSKLVSNNLVQVYEEDITAKIDVLYQEVKGKWHYLRKKLII